MSARVHLISGHLHTWVHYSWDVGPYTFVQGSPSGIIPWPCPSVCPTWSAARWSIPTFSPICIELRASVQGRYERNLNPRQVLFLDGDPGEEMYIVRKMTSIISKVVSGRIEQVLARAEAGDFFGEMSLFDRSPRSATIQAETEVALYVLDREHLHLLIEVNPRAAAAFFRSLVYVFIERLRASGELVAEITRWGLEATGLDMESR